MAVLTTPNYDLPYPDGNDLIRDGNDRIQDLAEKLDTDVLPAIESIAGTPGPAGPAGADGAQGEPGAAGGGSQQSVWVWISAATSSSIVPRSSEASTGRPSMNTVTRHSRPGSNATTSGAIPTAARVASRSVARSMPSSAVSLPGSRSTQSRPAQRIALLDLRPLRRQPRSSLYRQRALER